MGASDDEIPTPKVSELSAKSRSARTTQVLTGAGNSLRIALDAITEPLFSHYDPELKEAWLTACVIHCDLVRLLVAYEESEAGPIRLLWAGDIVSSLLEAREWLNRTGNPLILRVAKDRSHAQRSLKELSENFSLTEVERFRPYRHKVSHHYSTEISQLIGQLGREDSVEFYQLIARAARHMQGWIKLYREVARLSYPQIRKPG